MPQEFEGVTYWRHGRATVLDAETNPRQPLPNAEVTFTAVVGGATLTVRDGNTGEVITLVTDNLGGTPDGFWLNAEQAYGASGLSGYVSTTIELGSLVQNVGDLADAATQAAADAAEAALHPDYTRRYDGTDYVWWNGTGFVAGRPDLDPPYVVHAESTAYPDAPAPSGMVDGDTWTRVVPS